MSFQITLVTVAVMLLYAVPGYLLVKTKAVSQNAIPAFAKLLMYVSQPCLTVYSLTKVNFSMKVFRDMGLFFLITMVLQMAVMGTVFVLLRSKRKQVSYRVCNVAMCFGNVAFLGVPLVEQLLPEYPEAVVLSSAFFLTMNVLGWTAASAIITQDKSYISIKKILLNPGVLALVVALPLFFTSTKLPDKLNDMVTLLGRMSTPLCMLIMGMRLAVVKIKPIFTSKMNYLTVIIKQMIFPLIALAVISFFPVDAGFKKTLFILCCAPVASVVLNFAEMLGEGQESAANLVLLGTLSSVITIPLMMLLV